MFEGPFSESIVARARDRGILDVSFVNPRDFTEDRHRTVDDRPYGGGAGMLMMAEPLYRAACSAAGRTLRRGSPRAPGRGGAAVIVMTPQGRPFDQRTARALSKKRRLVLVCGHYEGFDERFLEYADMELSIGDYVLTGGEIPAMVVTDAVARLLPGVLTKEDAADEESFSRGLLDYPQYTRPRMWRGAGVPEVLLSGDHARILRWRRGAAEDSTKRRRKDLLNKL